MSLAKRFIIAGVVVSILEDKGAYTIEIAGCGSNRKKYEAVQAYLVEEGILDAVLHGRKGLDFDLVDVEQFFEKS